MRAPPLHRTQPPPRLLRMRAAVLVAPRPLTPRLSLPSHRAHVAPLHPPRTRLRLRARAAPPPVLAAPRQHLLRTQAALAAALRRPRLLALRRSFRPVRTALLHLTQAAPHRFLAHRHRRPRPHPFRTRPRLRVRPASPRRPAVHRLRGPHLPHT
ncbi:hypothetical protein C8R46DRAFT_346532 [Mycena filopes]|nr:hypothetical protein C8R46DRAFT_346532 [Mycena filopes]